LFSFLPSASLFISFLGVASGRIELYPNHHHLFGNKIAADAAFGLRRWSFFIFPSRYTTELIILKYFLIFF
jgi:hypothetical protein